MSRVTLTTASTDPFSANFKALPHGELGGPGDGPGVAKCVRLAVSTDALMGSDATLWLALRDDKNCYIVRTVTAAALASARAQTGGTGNYVATVDVMSSGRDIFDILGSGGKHGTSPNGPLRWWVGVATLPGGVSNLHVDSFLSNAI